MNDDSDQDLHKIWTSNLESDEMDISSLILQKDNKFALTVKWRNFREYLAGIIVIVVFGYYFFSIDNALMKIGSACTIVAVAYVTYQIRTRSSAAMKCSNAEPVVIFYRRKLERERDMLKSVWRWYILPFLPGFCLFMLGQRQMKPDADFSTYLTITLLLVIFVVVLNLWAAQKIQAQIDELP